QAGERIYIPAAAGAVGIAAVQLAKQRGAEVVAVSSTSGKRALTRTFGADETLDYTEQTKPCDVVLSMRGGALDEDIQRLAPFGRMVVYGAASTEPRSLSPACLAYLFDKPSLGQSITAFNLGAYFGLRQEQVGAAIGHVVQAYAKSSLQPCIGSILPLAAAPLIHRRLESRQSVGKAILQPTSDAQFNDDTVYASRLCRFDRHEDTMAFVWREETASMTLSDFQREMKRFGEMVAIHQTPHLLVDLRNFQYRGDTIPEQWRVQEVLPLYARGGASKMAFTASGHRGQDIQHDFGLKERWFDRADDAEAWLAS
ncbi:MAG: zinc-binding dehydrogenase, partial [Myxococcota bacterium]